jgi:hypothetical protein
MEPAGEAVDEQRGEQSTEAAGEGSLQARFPLGQAGVELFG